MAVYYVMAGATCISVRKVVANSKQEAEKKAYEIDPSFWEVANLVQSEYEHLSCITKKEYMQIEKEVEKEEVL